MLLAACSYHNKLPRGIFAAPAVEERVQASVLVPTSPLDQKQFVLKDYGEVLLDISPLQIVATL